MGVSLNKAMVYIKTEKQFFFYLLWAPSHLMSKFQSIFYSSWSKLSIGEYSARKIYFFPGQQKNCEKISPFLQFQKWTIAQNCTFLGKMFKISIFGGKLQKFANLGEKIEKNCIF